MRHFLSWMALTLTKRWKYYLHYYFVDMHDSLHHLIFFSFSGKEAGISGKSNFIKMRISNKIDEV